MSFLSKFFGTAKPDSAHAAIGMQREPDIDDPMERLEDRMRVARFLGAAEEGNPEAQAIVAVFIADAKGAPRDYIEAYKWCHLAASQGVKKADLIRDFLVGRMTRDQILEAEKRAAAFVPQRQ